MKHLVNKYIGAGTERWFQSRIFWIGMVAFVVGIIESNYMTAGLGITQAILRLTNFINTNLIGK